MKKEITIPVTLVFLFIILTLVYYNTAKPIIEIKECKDYNGNKMLDTKCEVVKYKYETTITVCGLLLTLYLLTRMFKLISEW